MDIYKNDFETQADLEAAIDKASIDYNKWATVEGTPAPSIHPIIKQIMDGATWNFIDNTREQSKQNKNKILAQEANDQLDSAKLAAQTTPSKRYGEFRSMEYAPIQDQLDMIFWDKINSTDIHQTHISGIKKKYPKPD